MTSSVHTSIALFIACLLWGMSEALTASHTTLMTLRCQRNREGLSRGCGRGTGKAGSQLVKSHYKRAPLLEVVIVRMTTYERRTLDEQWKVYWARRSQGHDLGGSDGFRGQV